MLDLLLSREKHLQYNIVIKDDPQYYLTVY